MIKPNDLKNVLIAEAPRIEKEREAFLLWLEEQVEHFIDSRLVDNKGVLPVSVHLEQMFRADLYLVLDKVIERYGKAGWIINVSRLYSFINRDILTFSIK